MSGTSLDGLDVALCQFNGRDDHIFNYTVLKAETILYAEDFRKKLTDLMKAQAWQLAEEHFQFGYFLGDQVRKFLSRYDLTADFVSSHGHTIFHRPERGFTFQLGHGACISARSGLPVVFDFRSQDIALGGQGAPLVPLGDKLLYSSYSWCLNLGGIANISFDERDRRVAFDVCPVNMVLNHLSLEKEQPFDRDGGMAMKGKTDEELLVCLERLDFYSKAAPKSLGKEWVEKSIFPLLDQAAVSTEDKLHTFCIHIARRIAACVKGNGAMLITGGGALNRFLIQEIKKQLPLGCKVVIPDMETILFKEAIVFAFLGYLKLNGQVNCLASVTGAGKDSSSGIMT